MNAHVLLLEKKYLIFFSLNQPFAALWSGARAQHGSCACDNDSVSF